MPQVGKRRFPYTERGIREAKEYAQKKGLALREQKPKRRVKK